MELSDVIRNLKGKREHLDIALNVLESFANTIEAPAPPAQLPAAPGPAVVEEPKPRRGRRPGTKATGRPGRKARGASALRCDKHPDCTEFDKKDRCRQCQRDYQKEYALRKKGGKAATPAYSKRTHIPGPKPKPHVPALDELVTDEVDIEDDFSGDEEGDPLPAAPAPRQFMWSKPTQCPKCREMTRLRRLAKADMAKDAWIHPGPNCIVKIAHYKIKDDPKFAGDPGATPPRSA